MSKTLAFRDALEALGNWFERQKRVLPWREEPTPYRVWISEIMLQQTRVATVLPYFERFVARFPNVESLATAPPEDVLALWAGLGYYSRARNLHAAARQIAARGRFPETREEWLELPGIGPYTAGAILSISADRAEPILDGNVERVLSRVRRVNRRTDAAYKARLWRLARIFVERARARGVRPSVLNQALMELGATVCIPRGQPACLLCPLQTICRARAAGDAPAYPPAKPRKNWLEVREERHGWVRDGRVLLRQCASGEWRAGLWDLMDRAPENGDGARLVATFETRHVVTRHKIRRTTRVWELPAARTLRAAESLVESRSDSRAADASTPTRWVPLDGDPGVPVGSAGRRSLDTIREKLGEEETR